MDGLHAYTAGAGTGKTYQICEVVADKLTQDDPVDPETVIATTFTNRAAAELKARVQERILGQDELDWTERLDLAEGLELAPIGTVHSVGRRLMERYALEMGLSPRLEVIDEDATQRHLTDLVAEMPPGPWQQLAELGRPLDLTEPKELARELLHEKRTNQISDEDFLASMRQGAKRVCEMLAPSGPDPDAPDPDQLASLAEQALDRIIELDEGTNATEKAIQDLQRFRRIRNPTWRNIVRAGNLNAGKRSGADDALDALRAFAAQARRMPQLHEDIHAFLDALAQQVLEIDRRYQAYKEKRGLLDFTDLEVLLLDALRDPDIREDIEASFDTVLVDEFQDSNPIQLALFIELHKIVGDSYWVGDPKQSIYKFRDADLDLAESAWELVDEENIDELATCYRSQEGLVNFFNEVFPPIFGPEARLDHDREDTGASLERWFLDAYNKDEEVQGLAQGIQDLADEGTPFRDIAVLSRTNFHAERIADTLEDNGIPTIVARSGLLDTREGATTEAGLRLAADPRDALAAAEIRHFLGDPDEATPAWLTERLHEVQNGDDGVPWEAVEPLASIREIPVEDRSPAAVVQAVIQELGLTHRIAAWGSPDRRAANLDRLVELAREYEEAREQQARGVSLRGFLAWLEELHGDDEDDVATPEGLDAVTVLTYHRSKGLEWPVVILNELEKLYDPDPWEPEVTGGRAEEGSPLEGRELRYWLWPFGEADTPWGGKTSGSGLQDDAARTRIGERLADEQEAEAKRLLYVGMTRARDKLVLTHRGNPSKGPKNTDWLDLVPVDRVLYPNQTEGESERPALSTSAVVRHLRPTPGLGGTPPPSTGIDIEVDAWDRPLVPALHAPSDDMDPSQPYDADPEPLPGPDPVTSPQTEEWRALGNAMHAYLAGLPSMQEVDPELREERARRCLEAHEVAGAIAAEQLVATGERLLAWIEETFPGAELSTEIPVVSDRAEGGRWFGIVDLLVETADGELVVVDHKTAPLPEEMWAEEAMGYAGQIDGYKRALEELDKPVRSGYVHFPFGGGLAELTPR